MKQARMIVHSRVGSDGMLHLTVPVGESLADQDVVVILNIQKEPPRLSQKEWHEFVEATAGKWQGEFPSLRDPELPVEAK